MHAEKIILLLYTECVLQHRALRPDQEENNMKNTKNHSADTSVSRIMHIKRMRTDSVNPKF